MNDSKPVLRRRKVQAKKARVELEPTGGITMRSDAIGAKNYALEEIERFLDGGTLDNLQAAFELLDNHKDGAVGDARPHFDRAMEELAAVDGVGE